MSESDLVEVRVPADVAYIATLRLVAASLAARCDLTVDEIEDLRLAVDEACALLLPLSATGDTLQARFTVTPGRLSVTVIGSGGTESAIDRGGFSWTVLTALASEVSVGQDGVGPAITVVKRRETASQ